MDARQQLLDDLAAGRTTTEQLVDRVVRIEAQLQTALQRIAELEAKTPPPPTLDYSMNAEEKRQKARGRKPRKLKITRRGRIKTADKIPLAKYTVDVYPTGLDPTVCWHSHTRVLWQLDEHRHAILVAYRIFRGPEDRYGIIPGAMGASEYRMDIAATIAHLVYVVGLSYDKVCGVLQFFQNLPLKKSQLDAILRHLAKSWEREFETLANLLANSAIVNGDETGWSLKSVWAFASEQAQIVLYGVPKDAETLQKILDPATFQGLLISDDAAVYENFTTAQKCWAHLIRKAIKLTLVEAQNGTYRTITDELLEIYRRACAARNDGRLGDAGRASRVDELTVALYELCQPHWHPEAAPSTGHANTFRLLINELMRLLEAGELFTFVTTPDSAQPNGASKAAPGTNNEAERILRNPAEARKTGRTSKTSAGARRQTIIMSVLSSLRKYLSEYTLSNVLDEIQNWWKSGRSCFEKWRKKLKIPVAKTSVLDQLYPPLVADPSG